MGHISDNFQLTLYEMNRFELFFEKWCNWMKKESLDHKLSDLE